MFCEENYSVRIVETTTVIVAVLRDPDTIPKYRRWTRSSAECYRRGCQCHATEHFNECQNLQYCSAPHAQFIMKNVVRKMVQDLGTDRISSDLQKAIEEEDYDWIIDSEMPEVQRYMEG